MFFHPLRFCIAEHIQYICMTEFVTMYIIYKVKSEYKYNL